MRRAFFALPLLSVALLGPLSPAVHAQLAWDGVSLVSPHAPQGLSVLLTSHHPSSSLGVLAHWRRDSRSLGLGYRVGLARDGRDDISVMGGVDFSGVLADGVEEADVQVLWWSGVGAGIASDLLVSVPLGLVVGWQGGGDDGTLFAPYLGGHAVLDLFTGGGDAVSLDAMADLGIDISLTSGWIVRFGASLGGRGTLGIGVRFPS